MVPFRRPVVPRPGVRIPAARPKSEPQPRGTDLLAVSFPDVRLSGVVLDDTSRWVLANVVREQRRRQELAQAGLHPTSRLVHVGPAGNGRALAAAALAAELGLPLFTLVPRSTDGTCRDLTASDVEDMVRAISETRAVFLLDARQLEDVAGLGRDAQYRVERFWQLVRATAAGAVGAGTDNDSIVVVKATQPPARGSDPRLAQAIVRFGPPDAVCMRGLLGAWLRGHGFEEALSRRVLVAGAGLSFSDLRLACDTFLRWRIMYPGNADPEEMLIAALRGVRRRR